MKQMCIAIFLASLGHSATADTPYRSNHAGHVPDTAGTNPADLPEGWLCKHKRANGRAGGPLGFRIGKNLD